MTGAGNSPWICTPLYRFVVAATTGEGSMRNYEDWRGKRRIYDDRQGHESDLPAEITANRYLSRKTTDEQFANDGLSRTNNHGEWNTRFIR